MEKELMVVDGHSILNRAFYGLRPLSTREGLPTGAVFGFLSMLGALLQSHNPQGLCVVFDEPGKTFRNDMYDAYKATRKPAPDDFTAQVPIIQNVLKALRIPIYSLAGYEADDLLGTVSKICAESSPPWRCGVVTGDRDSFQLVNDKVRVLYVGTKETRAVTPETVMADYGLTPAQLIDLKALMGDASDNIPGIPGVGEKTALTLMRDYGSLDGVYENLEKLSGKLKEKVESGREKAYLSRKLAEIDCNVPFDFSPEDCLRKPPDAAALRPLFQKLEFQKMLARWLPESAPQSAGNLSMFDSGVEEKPLPEGVFRNVKAIWKGDFDAGRPLTPCKADLSLASWLLQAPETDWPEMESLLKEHGLWKLFSEIEMPLCEVLAYMEHIGMKADRPRLVEYGRMLAQNIAELERQVYVLAGETFNIGSPKQLGAVLFDKMRLPHGKKNKTGWVTDADTLNKLRHLNPIVQTVLDYRTLSKLKSTYADGLLKVMDEDDHIHSTFQMTVAITGRLSSTEPNLQNIPVRTELGGQLRDMFIPSRPGWVLVDADYSQIELRVLAHIARDETMMRAFREGEDIHTVTASQVFGVKPKDITPLMRRRAKAVNFGIVYGISAFSLSDDIGVSVQEAGDYIKTYLEKYSGVQCYMKDIVERARADGYVTTLLGRRRFLPELNSPNYNIRSFGERAALNTPIQGTAADIIKKAMVAVYRRLKDAKLQARLILQVHDELIVECPESEAEEVRKLLTFEMENAFPMDPPLVAEAHIGKTWAQAK
ncbi:MAG: DNA polymerase I [Oscillospiraceae bacterium]|jgi:DNA polymerase-1|nr:DNA polymerase I [Oscillospiraceae bacterium]